MNQRPDMHLHSACCLLFGLGLVASLWLYGHPALTILMLLLIPLMVALPMWRGGASRWRSWIRVGAAVTAVLWSTMRYSTGTTTELALVECVSILGFSCVTGRTRREYVYLGLVILAQFVYGAVQPPRAAFLFCMLLALPLAGSLAYRFRSGLVSGVHDLPVQQGLVSARVAQLGLAVIMCGLFFSLFPNRPGPRFGVVYVTPPVHKRVVPSFKSWFNPSPDHIQSPDGERQVDGPDPSSLSSQSSYLVQAANGQGMRGDGNGGGEPGGDLVFRIKSPSRLYLLCQLYDAYDGIEWHASRRFKRARFWPVGRHHRVPQQVTVEKWLTRRLPLAYWPASITTFDHGRSVDRESFYSFRVSDDPLPPLPFQYTGWSWLAQEGGNTVWGGNMSKSQFLGLPDSRISERVRDLATEITQGIDDPYAKALTLRNYLRANYEYDLYSKKLPEGREAADYFLFEIKAGHCEYFACALTVLARLNDLPARVALGFSPGKYNSLTGTFDVYEYHAHAWTQIFVEGRGWLTMDASPPSEIRVEKKSSLPFFRDPFSDDWKVKSPEEAREVEQFDKAQMAPRFDMPKWFDSKKDDGPKDRLSALMALRNAAPAQLSTWRRVKAVLIEMLERLKGYWQLFVDELSVTLALQLFIFMVGVNMLVFLFPGFRESWRRRIRRRRCRELHAVARSQVEGDAVGAVDACYRLAREMLSLHGFEKPANQELADFAEALATGLVAPATTVFVAYSRSVYSPITISSREASRVLEATEDLLAQLAQV